MRSLSQVLVQIVGLLSTLTAVWAASPQFGPTSTGGGFAVVCRDSFGAIVKPPELLDLYEARVKYGFTLFNASGDIHRDYLMAVQNTYHLQGYDSAVDSRSVNENLKGFLRIARWTLPGQHLTRLNDLGETIEPPLGCGYEQLAIFHDLQNQHLPTKDQSVEVDTEIWSAMDSLNQAALLTHEGDYIFERELLQRTSEETRANVAHIYAATGTTPILQGLPAEKSICLGGLPNQQWLEQSTKFFLFRQADPAGHVSTVFQFVYLLRHAILTKATVILPLANDTSPRQVFRSPVIGSQHRDWEIEAEFAFGSPTKLRLYQKGLLAGEHIVQQCSP